MSVVSVKARSFILALFIRDDGERFLLGDNGYDFKDSQLHFSANTIENDEVQKQGADGVMLAGQVRRSSVQSFDGYVGDATTLKETIEEMRRDFIAFFAKGHHFRVIYIDTARNAWQRKGGYLVDAPEVKELYQIHPDYHVGLNFEDVNYYSYDEDKDGNEILSNLIDVPVSTDAEGGLVWDEDGAVSEDAGDIYYDTAESSASGKSIAISDAAEAPLVSFQLDGETSQNGTPTPSAPVAVQTVTGENVVKISDGQNEQSYEVNLGKNLCDGVSQGYWINGVANSAGSSSGDTGLAIPVLPNTDYSVSTKTTQARYRAAFVDSLPASGSSVSAYNGVARDGQDTSFTRNSGTQKYLIINATNLSDIQVELGSTATSYAAYFEPIELCKIGDYQDYIYKSGSDWKIHKACAKYRLDSAKNWPVQGTVNYQCTLSGDNRIYLASSAKGYSNYFRVGNSGTDIYMYPILQSNTDYIRIANATSEWASTDLFKTFLTNNAVYLYYPLAESAQTDSEITNAALVAQLDALLTTARTYVGINNIFTITPNEQGTLEISYYTKYQPMVGSGGYVWEAGGAGGATTVINNSIGNVNPVWTIYGPTNNPVLENATTGEQIEYVGLIAEGQTLTIDMSEQTASLDGLNVISNVIGDYISLAPGANTLIYSVSGDAGASELGWSEIVG